MEKKGKLDIDVRVPENCALYRRGSGREDSLYAGLSCPLPRYIQRASGLVNHGGRR